MVVVACTGDSGGRQHRGRVVLALGVLVLLFAAFQLWGTGLFEAHDQSALRGELTKTLPHDAMDRAARIAAHPPKAKAASGPPAVAPPASAPADGQPIGTIQIPNIGLDQVVVEGVGTDAARDGPRPLPGHARCPASRATSPSPATGRRTPTRSTTSTR